jgi:hypothetical protein
MISYEVQGLLAGLEDDAVDVDALFDADVQGKTGLFPGQLVAELREARPALLPRLELCVRRALAASDPAARVAGLHGALQLPREMSFSEELKRLSALDAGVIRSPEFIELVERQPVASVAALTDAIDAEVLEGHAVAARARLLASHRRDSLKHAWKEAVAEPLDATSQARLVSEIRAMSMADVDGIADALAGAEMSRRERASDIFFEAWDASTSPAHYDYWLQLHRRMSLSYEGLPPRPPESDEELERRQALAARLAARLASTQSVTASVKGKGARSKKGAPASLPKEVVLGLPVWLDALRIPEGPPSALFDGLARHRVRVLCSARLLNEIDEALERLGWSDSARAAARGRIALMSSSVPGGGELLEGALARAARLDTVWTVGADVGRTEDGVAWRPVHALLKVLASG